MTKNKARKHDARILAAATGDSYTRALRHEDAETAIRRAAEGLANARARASAAAEALAAIQDPELQAEARFEDRSARCCLELVELWEDRRAGRPLRLWEAVIQVRVAASTRSEAFRRYGIICGWPCYRVPAEAAQSLWWHDFEPGGNPEHRLVLVKPSERDRRQLEAGYPPAAHDAESEGPFGNGALSARERIFVEDYAAALRRARNRLTGQPCDLDDDALFAQRWPPRPGGEDLTIWSLHYRALFLAGIDRSSARARAVELAATVVDYAGRPAGKLVGVRPNDGARSDWDNTWEHPVLSPYLGPEAVTALFDDDQHAQGTIGDPLALAAILDRGANDMLAAFDRVLGSARAGR